MTKKTQTESAKSRKPSGSFGTVKDRRMRKKATGRILGKEHHIKEHHITKESIKTSVEGLLAPGVEVKVNLGPDFRENKVPAGVPARILRNGPRQEAGVAELYDSPEIANATDWFDKFSKALESDYRAQARRSKQAKEEFNDLHLKLLDMRKEVGQ